MSLETTTTEKDASHAIDIIPKIVEMVEASTYDKYSLGDSRTIIYGFLLFKLMVSSIESSCLYGLVAGIDQPHKNLSHPSALVT
jgi:hypothetical protein